MLRTQVSTKEKVKELKPVTLIVKRLELLLRMQRMVRHQPITHLFFVFDHSRLLDLNACIIVGLGPVAGGHVLWSINICYCVFIEQIVFNLL